MFLSRIKIGYYQVGSIRPLFESGSIWISCFRVQIYSDRKFLDLTYKFSVRSRIGYFKINFGLVFGSIFPAYKIDKAKSSDHVCILVKGYAQQFDFQGICAN